MGLNIQELIEDCSTATVRRRNQSIRRALKRYKYGQTAPGRYGRSTQEEREFLENAMRKYKEFAFTEEQVRAYNILLYFYFASRPLTDAQIARLFHIDKRTVHKSISKGVKELAIFIYGIGGIELHEGDSVFWNNAYIVGETQKRLESGHFNRELMEMKGEVLKLMRSLFFELYGGNEIG